MAEDRMLSDEVLLALIKKNSGGGGTRDYSQLTNKPEINGVTLSGDKSASDLSLASLDANGKVPAAQLPSYVDDVINGYLYEGHFYEDAEHQTEITGESGKIYIDLETNKTYRWSGLAFVEISESLALGETASTAYAGDKGKANADAITAIKDGQTIDSFGDVESALANKVDKVDGKGLSTNDYTDADKAIVGGVTAALAGKQDTLTFDSVPTDGSTNPVESNGVYDALALKADASIVKKEFIGTTAEWNALTTAQKKEYDTYQLTDDYTEGSGGLPDYSTTEQKTGQKWIDGKDIYFKTYQTTTTPNVDTYIDLTSANIDNIISNDGTFFIDASGNQAVAQYFNSSNDRLQMYYDVANNRLVIRSVSSVLTIYVTLKYTKTA